MQHLSYEQHPDWKAILDLFYRIQQQQDYSPDNVEFIRHHLQSYDDRIRGGAAMVAAGCLFEPYILDIVINIAEYDDNTAVRKAAIQSLRVVINEGVLENLENESGFNNAEDTTEEWHELQSANLQNDYLRVKELLYFFLESEEVLSIQETALIALADLGFLEYIRQKINEFMNRPQRSSQLVALHAIGKYPCYWEDALTSLLTSETNPDLLKEAISACYASDSTHLAQNIEKHLQHSDPEVLRFALLTLSNINKTPNLMEILQKFSTHSNSLVQEAARDGIELCTQKNFNDYLKDNLDMDS